MRRTTSARAVDTSPFRRTFRYSCSAAGVSSAPIHLTSNQNRSRRVPVRSNRALAALAVQLLHAEDTRRSAVDNALFFSQFFAMRPGIPLEETRGRRTPPTAGRTSRGVETHMFARLLLSAASTGLLALTVAPPAFAQNAPRKDFQVLQDVTREVRRYVNYTVFDDISAGVDNGVVTLTGKVTMPYKRTDIEKRVAKVLGARSVVNQIDVLPVSQFDDQLRYRIARAIYGNPNFWSYASMVNPPIHIVVERGHVTLAGVVRSEVDRMLARSLATSFGSFSVTNDLKTDEEVRQELERLT